MTTLMQYKVVRYVNLEFLRWSAVCLLSADCLLFTKNHLEASNTKTAQSQDVLNESLEFLR